MSSIMVEQGQARVAFGDVVRLVRDRVDPEDSGLERYVAGEHMDTDDLKIRRWGLIADGYLGPAFHMRFKPGHVLYGSRRTYLRKVAVPDFEGICANTTFVLETRDPELLLPELLPHIMRTESFHKHSIEQSKGSVNPYVNFSDLAWYEFALPPLEEQRRIAEALQAAEAAKEAAAKVQARLAASGLALVESFLRKNASDTLLDSILESTTYGTSQRATTDEVGLPVLRIPNVLRGSITLDDLKWTEMSAEDEDRYRVDEGDILFVRTNGNPDYVGRCVVARDLPRTFVYASYLIRLRVDPDRVLPEFLTTLLNAPSTRRALRGEVRSSAGNYNINTKGIRSQRIPLPSLATQAAFIASFSTVKEAVDRIAKRIREIQGITRALLSEVDL